MLRHSHDVYLAHVAQQKRNVVHEIGYPEDSQPQHKSKLISEIPRKDLPNSIGLGNHALVDVEQNRDD